MGVIYMWKVKSGTLVYNNAKMHQMLGLKRCVKQMLMA